MTTNTTTRHRGRRYTARVTATVPDDTRTRLDQAAQQLDRDLSWVMRQALDQWLDRHHPAQ